MISSCRSSVRFISANPRHPEQYTNIYNNLPQIASWGVVLQTSVCRLPPALMSLPGNTAPLLGQTLRRHQRWRLRHGHSRLVDPIGLAARIVSQLVDRDELVGGVTIGVEGLVTGDPIQGSALDGIDHRLAERFGPGLITRVGRGMRPVGQRRLDRLDQDVRTVIGRRAVHVQRVRKGRGKLRAEGCRRWNGSRFYHSNRAVDRAATAGPNSGGKAGGDDTIPTT